MSRYRIAVDVGGTFTDIFVFEEEVCQYELDLEATKREREWIRERRLGWLEEDPERVRERLLRNEIDILDAIRRHG